jgi:hypothetical protein
MNATVNLERVSAESKSLANGGRTAKTRSPLTVDWSVEAFEVALTLVQLGLQAPRVELSSPRMQPQALAITG